MARICTTDDVRTSPSLVDANGRVLVRDIRDARTPWTRTIGLLGRKRLSDDEGMVFKACSSVHTYFMRMPIDVVFVDESWRVLRVIHALPPWRVAHGAGAAHAIELAPGKAQRAAIQSGMLLQLGRALD